MTTNNSNSLSKHSRRCREIEGPYITTLGMLLWEKVTLDVDFVLDLFVQLSDLLRDTHRQGYAVGTLHPEGIVIVMQGDTLKSAHIKKSGAPCGFAFTDEISLSFDKSNYMSPEQLDGLSPSPCSDIYTLGCMMHVALNGTPPFSNDKKPIRLTAKKRSPESVSDHKREYLDAVVKVCLQNEETQRYRSVSQLKFELARIQRGIAPECAKRERKNPFANLNKGFVSASICLLLWLASVTAMQGQTSPVIEGIWNKSPDQYEYGDRFTITLKAKQKCFAYVFYLTNDGQSLAIFPSRHQGNNTVGVDAPLAIENVDSNMMQVDTTPGSLVIVSITDGFRGRAVRDTFLQDGDWISEKKPRDHWLSLSGDELIRRVEAMKSMHPDLVYYSVQDAPRAKERTEPLRFGKPMRVEISIGVN